jgi:hypothetical protein
MTRTELLIAIRLASQFAGTEWYQAGSEVLDTDGGWVADAKDHQTASYIATIHNAFLPLASLWVRAKNYIEDLKKAIRITDQ